MDPEDLINAVQKRSFLYDKDDQNYCNRRYINEEWKKIAKEVGCGEIEARKRWTKLRDYFRKTHYEMTCPKSGPAAVKKKRWYLYDKMLFVLPYLRDNKPTDANAILCSSSDEDDQGFRDDTPSAISSLAKSSFASVTMEDNIVANELVDEKQFSKNENKSDECSAWFVQDQSAAFADMDSEMLKIMKELKELIQNKRLHVPDEDEHFFQNLVPKMKLLNTIDKMECQAEIHMTVLRYIKKRGLDSHHAPKHLQRPQKAP